MWRPIVAGPLPGPVLSTPVCVDGRRLIGRSARVFQCHVKLVAASIEPCVVTNGGTLGFLISVPNNRRQLLRVFVRGVGVHTVTYLLGDVACR
jgi:hypothetical protein